MDGLFGLADDGTVMLFGVRLVGVNADSGRKVLLTIALVVGVMAVGKLLRALIRGLPGRAERIAFWIRQAIHLLTAIVLVIGLASIWFDKSDKLTAAAGMITAGVAFALQRVITAFAGYFIILKGNNFGVGDRIMMGGVRGDVVALGFMQTTIMEMGQTPGEQADNPSMWVKSRQYTGRIVTVSNSKIFDEPVFNYTREFPFIWEEMTVPIAYRDDRDTAERILLNAAARHTIKMGELGEEAIKELERRYAIARADMGPRVYFRMTDNWLEMTVRFITRDHGIRDVKDAMTRDILPALDSAGIGIASATFEIVGLPPLRVQRAPAPAHDNGAATQHKEA